MFKKIDNYLIVAIISSTLVVLFALLSIDMLGKILAETGDVGHRNYDFGKMLAYVFGLVPLKLALFFPMALLIGALMGLGKLAAGSELTVMQTSGVSRFRIGVVGFLIAMILGAIVVVVTEFVGVPLNTSVTQMRDSALGRVSSSYGAGGVWAQDDKTFVNIRGVTAKGELANVRIFSFDDRMTLKQIRQAKTAKAETGKWQLNQVTTRTIQPKVITVESAKHAVWENHLDNSVLDLLLFDPEDLSIRDLYRYISYQKANGIRPTTYSLTFWQRLFIPLSTGVMFLLALPFVFGSQRSSSQGKKLFIGILFGLFYYVSYTGIANIILLTGAPVIFGAIIPIALFLMISFTLLWRRG